MKNSNIGAKVKELRIKNKLTLKQLGEKTSLSVGFLSQFERGMTSIAIDSLGKIAEIFSVEMSAFFETEEERGQNNVIRSYDKHSEAISDKIIQYTLSRQVGEFSFLTREFHLMPHSRNDEKEPVLYSHSGEEFIYVLQGILSLETDGGVIELYPGDSIEIDSNTNHNWFNKTGEIAKFLCINTPNPYKVKE